jgi:hypothetical protein
MARSGSTKLWVGASVLFVSAFIGKQILWQKVSKEVGSIREIEHKKNVEHYHTVIEKRQQYALPKLTDEEKLALKKHFDSNKK